MNAFIVDLENKPAELAKVAEAIAEKGIDITGFSGSTLATAARWPWSPTTRTPHGAC